MAATIVIVDDNHVERFQDRDGSLLAPQRDRATRLMIAAHLRFHKD